MLWHPRGVEKEWGVGGQRGVTRGRGMLCGSGTTEATLSQERSSFDLIIWEGQSAFVDEESL